MGRSRKEEAQWGGVAAMTPNRQTSLGPYELISPIGAGGMGEVFRARDIRLNREVAIKVLLNWKALFNKK